MRERQIMSDTKEEAIAAKYQAAVDAATVDGVTNVVVTLKGDGEIHDGTSASGRMKEGDAFKTDPATAFRLTEAGYVTPKKAKG